MAVGFGLGCVYLAMLTLVRFGTKQFCGWWRYLVRPLLVFACIQSVIFASLSLMLMRFYGNERLLPLFFILFPSVMAIVLMCINPPQRMLVVPPLPGSFAPRPAVAPQRQPLAAAARYVWLAPFVIAITLGPMLLLAPFVASNWRDPETATAVGFGLGCLYLAVLSLARFNTTLFAGWWRYLFRPLLIFACVQSILLSSMILMMVSLRGEESLVALFFLIFPLALGTVLLCINAGDRQVALSPAPLSAVPAATPLADITDPAAQVLPQPTAPPPSWLAAQASLPPRPRPRAYNFNPGSILLSFIGIVVLIAAVVCGLLVAVDLPGFIAAGYPDRQLGAELGRAFGYANWPPFLHSLGLLFTSILAFLAAALLVTARRRHGLAHMLRGMAAVGVWLLGVVWIGAAFHGQWPPAGTGTSMPFAIQSYMGQTSTGPAIYGLIAMAVALVLLLVPARKPAPQLQSPAPQEATR